MAADDVTDSPPLLPGHEIEVRTRFDHRWVDGFEIAARENESYFLRRHSDHSLLPLPFSRGEIRVRV